MKTVKMAFKVVLALSLPFNAIASGSTQGAGTKELSIESKLEIQDLKLKRDTLLIDIAKSTLALEALEDIADPSLISFYRQYDLQIGVGTATVGAISMATIATTMSGTRQIEATSKLLPAFKTATGVTAGAIVLTMGQLLHYIAQGDGYKSFHTALENATTEEKMAAYRQHKNIVIEGTAEVQKIDQQIEALK